MPGYVSGRADEMVSLADKVSMKVESTLCFSGIFYWYTNFDNQNKKCSFFNIKYLKPVAFSKLIIFSGIHCVMC